jgi:uncharacterized phage protein (TIGR01671 family)
MREIKFRAWNSDYFEYRDFNFKAGHLGCNFSCDVKIDQLEQFTGLKDKNGVDIYEGDIVRAFSQGSMAIGDIKWGKGRVGFFILINNGNSANWSLSGGGPNHDQETVEVIGNVHQNPELLEG